MAIHKPYPNQDITSSLSVVSTGDRTDTYQRGGEITYASGDQLNVFRVLAGRFLAGDDWIDSTPLVNTSADRAGSVSGDASLYYAALENRRHVFVGIDFGYSATPTNGAIQVESPSGTIIYGPVPVTSAGYQSVDCHQGLPGALNQDVLIRLKGGGGSVSGSLTIKGRRIE